MIVAQGLVVAVEDGQSIIRMEHPSCTGCIKQCVQRKNRLFRVDKPIESGTKVLLTLPAHSLSVAMLLILGVPLVSSSFSYFCTSSPVWTLWTFSLTLLSVHMLFRQFRVGDYLLRPTIRRIN